MLTNVDTGYQTVTLYLVGSISVNLMLLKASVEFLCWGGVGLGGVGGVHINFHVQPKYSVEVVFWLCCVVVGVVTI